MNTQITKQNIDQIFHPGFITDYDKFVEFINTNRDLAPCAFQFDVADDSDGYWDWMQDVDSVLDQNKHQFMYEQANKILYPNTDDVEDKDDIYDDTAIRRREAIMESSGFISDDFQDQYFLHTKNFNSKYLNFVCMFDKHCVFRGVDDQFYLQTGFFKRAKIKAVSQEHIVDLFNNHLAKSCLS